MNYNSMIDLVHKIISIKSFKKVTKSTMIFAGIYFAFGNDIFQNFDIKNVKPQTHSILLIKVISLYFILNFIFYNLIELVLRWLIHNKFRARILSSKHFLDKNSTFSDKKELTLFIKYMATFLFNYAFRLGFISTNSLKEPIIIQHDEKIEVFDSSLKELYSSVALIIHSTLTCIIVFKFYSIWLISLMVLAIIMSILFTYALAYLLLHLDYLEPIRKELIKKTKKLI